MSLREAVGTGADAAWSRSTEYASPSRARGTAHRWSACTRSAHGARDFNPLRAPSAIASR